MLAKYFSVVRNYVLSVFSQRKYTVYHQNTVRDAFRTNSRNITCRNPSMVIPLLANQDFTPMLTGVLYDKYSMLIDKRSHRGILCGLCCHNVNCSCATYN